MKKKKTQFVPSEIVLEYVALPIPCKLIIETTANGGGSLNITNETGSTIKLDMVAVTWKLP